MESYQFKAEIQQLLNILVHSLYTDREVFVRELLSNATDALHRLQFEMLTNRDVLDPDAELAVRVHVDQEAKTVTFSDSGIGMTCDEMIDNLGTIAQSGAAAFIQRLQEMDPEKRPALEMIGQFGVGFYSTFMAASQVRVVSRSYRLDAKACEWTSDGSASFRVGPATKESRGTDVIVYLKEDAQELAATWRMQQIIKKYSDFSPFPIYVDDQIANRQKSLWRQPAREVEQEAYIEFYKHLTIDPDPPLLYTHMVSDVPVDIRSILYVPSRRERGPIGFRSDYGLRLYAKGVMIEEHNKDMLPNYFRFVEGVLESEDLPLNVSREAIQHNPAGRRIQKALVNKLVKELETMAQDKPEEYARFWHEFGVFIKEGVATDFAGQEELLPLLRFSSLRAAGQPDHPLISLDEYVEHMAEDQKALYYLLGEDLESIVRSPHLDYFRANDLDVLYLVDPVDSFLVMSLNEYKEKPLKSIDDASLDLPQKQDPEEEKTPAVSEEDLSKLIGRVMQVLGDRVTQVRESRILRDSPCRLVSPENAPGQNMQRVYRLLNQEFQVPPKILELNRSHPLIRNLARLVLDTPDAPVIDMTIEQLYENQLLVEGIHPNPAAMISRIQSLMEAATAPGS